MELVHADHYFEVARERENIRRRREAGGRGPWSDDKHLSSWRFCNVHRENDKTTKWFAENVRNHLGGFGVVRATVIFRWFNRIETGEIIKDLLLDGWDTEEARRRLKNVHPVVTGAYIIKAADGYSKLDGILRCVDEALPRLEKMTPNWFTLRGAWEDLCTIWYLGRFMAYEIVSDLRWTDVLQFANDKETWANAGPGCARGLGWVRSNNSSVFNPGSPKDQKEMLQIMKELLWRSHGSAYWPTEWQRWEMREVEHWACEYDKYRRAARGDKLKRRFTWK